jgi:hypothetical protein
VCGIPQLRLRRDLRDVLPGAGEALAQRPGVAAGDLVLLGMAQPGREAGTSGTSGCHRKDERMGAMHSS